MAGEPEPRERFLRAIVERIPAERIAEIHLFPALRSGGRESAVAVIAATPDDEFEQGTLPPPVGETAPDPTAAADRPPRLVVYRAVYRWTRKGPDRGKWEMDLKAEADAPLGAVAEVVRGVQRRAGDDGEPELITSDGLRVAISGRPWAAAS